MSTEKERKKEEKRKAREERQKSFARTMSLEELKKDYKMRNRLYIAFLILTILSAFFRPWFYTVILIVITVREKSRKDDMMAAIAIKNGESLK